jgi:hypothetical protein
MKVRLLKDWNFHKAGDVVDVFEPTGKNWIATGIADPFAVEAERRDVVVETTDDPAPQHVERAVRKHSARRR